MELIAGRMKIKYMLHIIKTLEWQLECCGHSHYLGPRHFKLLLYTSGSSWISKEMFFMALTENRSEPRYCTTEKHVCISPNCSWLSSMIPICLCSSWYVLDLTFFLSLGVVMYHQVSSDLWWPLQGFRIMWDVQGVPLSLLYDVSMAKWEFEPRLPES